MKIALAQYPITAFTEIFHWRQHAGQWVENAVRQGAQLIVFPEYGAMELTSLLPEAEKGDLHRQITALDGLKDDFLDTFSALARRWQTVIIAPSLPVMDQGRALNRAHVFSPKGLAGHQDKWFMTRFEDEEWGIRAPEAPELSLFEADWGSFGIQICYDVEFPLGSALLCAHGAELIVAPSCTETIRGATRVHVGARARALENQCFTAVSQTIGDAPWSPAVDVNYGFAALYSTPDMGLPEEGIVASMAPQQPGWLVQELDFQKIKTVREAGQVFNFKDQQRIGYGFEGQAPVVRRVRL